MTRGTVRWVAFSSLFMFAACTNVEGDVGGEPSTDGASPDAGEEAAPSNGASPDARVDDAVAADAGADASDAGSDADADDAGGDAESGGDADAGGDGGPYDPATFMFTSFDPLGPATPADLVVPGVGDLVLPPPADVTTIVTLDTDTGSIRQGAVVLRAANVDPDLFEIADGVGFRRDGGMGIFVVHSFSVGVFATASGSVSFAGSRPAAVIASTTVKVDGTVRVAAGGGKGGLAMAPGGAQPTAGTGPGGGAPGRRPNIGTGSGGGGGGYAAVGGRGGTINLPTYQGGTGGVAYSAVTLGLSPPLVAGSGGGGGGSLVAVGGAGAGSLQLVAGISIMFAGTTEAKRGGVNAGGFKGIGNMPGGGGGSGGTIVVEAPNVVLEAFGTLAANGAGAGATPADGKLSDAYAGGDAPVPGFPDLRPFGSGGAGAELFGSPASFGPGSGGGGAAGRIYIRTKDGAITWSAPTAIVSPYLGTTATTLGMIDVVP